MFISGIAITFIGLILIIIINIFSKGAFNEVISASDDEIDEEMEELRFKLTYFPFLLIIGSIMIVLGLFLIIYTKHPHFNNKWNQ